MPLEAGRQLEPYEIVSSIGAGGMGAVYQARDTKLDRQEPLRGNMPAHYCATAARGRI